MTSETGKRIGGKAVDLLEQKIQEALGEKIEPPKVKQPVVVEKVEGAAL